MKYAPNSTILLTTLTALLFSAEPVLAEQQNSVLATYHAYSLLTILLILLTLSVLAQQRAVNRFRDSDQRHQSILQIALNGIYTTDSLGNLLEVNDTYCRMSGYSRVELLMMNICDLEARETAEQVLAHHQRLQDVDAETFESLQRRKNGSCFDVEIGLKFLPGGGGKTIAYVQDISARKRAEKELLSKQYTLEKAHEIALLGAWEYDVAEATIILTEQTYHICELQPGTPITPKVMTRIVHPEDRKHVLSCIHKAVSKKTPFDIEHRLLIDEIVKWVRTIGHPVTGRDGELSDIIGVTQDISIQRQIQDDHRRSAQLAVLGTVAAGVAHEINNPIQGILNYAGLLKETAADSAHTNIIAERIENESLRIAKITRELLNYSRDNKADFAVVAIDETIEGALTLMRRKITKQGIQLYVDCQEGLPQLKVNPQNIQQIAINLLDNSCDALSEKEDQQSEKEIRLHIYSCERAGAPYVCISVRDNGDGMSKQLQKKAQEVFFTTKKMGSGTGLGLSIINNIAQKHDATIEVESVLKQFTVVRLLLPQQPEK